MNRTSSPTPLQAFWTTESPSRPYDYVPFNESSSTIFPPLAEVPTCTRWTHPQHFLYQLANVCFCVSYIGPSGKYGTLTMHVLLIFSFLLAATWAWNVICQPNVFSWNFCFILLNLGQTLYCLYTMREVKLPAELEDIYESMFHPLKVSRLLFKKLVSPECAQVMSLHAGEAYAMQNLTKTDRLALLITGKVNVISHHNFLHFIHPKEFLDSPEFESYRTGSEEKFKVSIIAASHCRYIFWTRQSLEFFLIKETYLASVLSLLLSRDITTKLYSMNDKIVTEKGSHLDIRLPSLTGSMVSQTTTTVTQEDNNPPPFHSPGRPSHRTLSRSTAHKHSVHANSVQNSIDMYKDCDTDDSVFGSKERIPSTSTTPFKDRLLDP